MKIAHHNKPIKLTLQTATTLLTRMTAQATKLHRAIRQVQIKSKRAIQPLIKPVAKIIVLSLIPSINNQNKHKINKMCLNCNLPIIFENNFIKFK